MSLPALQDRIENLLDRCGGETGSPSRQELNDLYADSCAVLLTLETEQLRVERRMTAATLERLDDPEAAQEATALVLRRDELVVELTKLKPLVRQLRSALEDALEAEPPGPPRRRFRRHRDRSP